ncbi:glycosyl transferase (plasmid) [Leisingera sp. NJS201]|uniref:glycosyltransferase n=1 Tax=Leisingera sp. NJS201 TaxID=2508306 RepID=UPI0010712DB5|nr:glycosyltransferase [Leisingera sp. NJS201]QBR38573.1 glycosyl transferase [Leisingera sp. NJS201]
MKGSGRPLRLLVFGFDAAEAAQIRRIRSYMECGFEVRAFTMRRDNMNAGFEPFWENVHLSHIRNENFSGRVRAIISSVGKVARNWPVLQGTDVIVARNLDMLAIAAAAQMMITPRPPLIYECLDIHGLMTSGGAKGRLFRAAERRLLARCASLIVSSPAFLRNYFEPVQGWTGASALIENKLWAGPDGPARPTVSGPGGRDKEDAVPLVLGWVGTLRCSRSLALLAAAARQLGLRLRVVMHGAVHHHALPEFDAVLAAHPNMSYAGPYDYPSGLARIYEDCDLVWSQDLWQWGTNSTWLLPNRIYEASYFGCPSIAVAGTETGQRVARGLGWCIPAPSEEALVAFLRGLRPAAVAERRRALLEMPASLFRQTPEEIRDAILLPLGGGNG